MKKFPSVKFFYTSAAIDAMDKYQVWIQPILKGSQFTGAEGGGNHCTADNETEKLGLDLAVFNAFE